MVFNKAELLQNSPEEFLELKLENKIPFKYPKSDLGYYLSSLFRSLYEHDQMIRSLILGLAGKDTRKAMEIFLDFCRSGHVGMAQIQKIKMAQGRHPLPYHVVSRVLLRGDKRFYDGDASHVKNLFQCDPNDANPSPFVRIDILNWLKSKRFIKGPNGIKGYFQCSALVSDLVSIGHDQDRVVEDINYLISHGCIIIEHQDQKMRTLDDLVILSPAGFQHLRLLNDITYLAACSEDAWVEDSNLALRVAERIRSHSPRDHFSVPTSVANASEFIDYLVKRQDSGTISGSAVASDFSSIDLDAEKLKAKAQSILKEFQKANGWESFNDKFKEGEAYQGRVVSTRQFGVFVRLDDGPVGLLHRSKLNGRKLKRGNSIEVVIEKAFPERQRLQLRLNNRSAK